MLNHMIEFRIDRHSGVSTYVQIIKQVKQAMRLGVLGPGDRLPTAREVVEATAVNPNTVLKAYRELERDGMVEARRGVGTFVTQSLASELTTVKAPLRQELADWMGRAENAGLTIDEVDALVAAVRDEHFHSEGPHAS